MTTRSRKPAAERREEIACAALDIIGRQGLAALTTTALAKAIGVTSGALFRHFDSRERILEEMVFVAERALEATYPDPDLPPVLRLRTLALARIELLSARPGLAWLLRSEQAFLTLPPVGVKRLQAVAERSRRFLHEGIRAAVEAGDLRDDVPLRVLITTFVATVHALIGQPTMHGRATPAVDPAPMLDGLLQLLAPQVPNPSEIDDGNS